MTKGRIAGAVAAAFVVSQILAIVVHGFLLDADYAPFRGSLLRAQASWQMLLLPASHLLFIAALVWILVASIIEAECWRRGRSLACSAGSPARHPSGCCGTPSSRGRGAS